jgi:diguanylate cyclase (GGDEF)-like protein
MKKTWGCAFAIVLVGMSSSGSGGWGAAAWAAEPDAIASVRAVQALSNTQAKEGLPVRIEATVTYYRDSGSDLFVQNDDGALYVHYRPGADLQPGDRVRIDGKTEEGFRPIVAADDVALLRHEAVPAAIPASFEEVIGAQLTGLRVSVAAVVRSATMVGTGPKRSIYLDVLMDGGYVGVAVNSADESALKMLVDAQVEISGIAVSKFDQKMQLAGARIVVQSLADVKVLKTAAVDPDSLPLSAFDDVLSAYHVQDQSRRVRVRGTITYYQPGSSLVLQNGSKSLWVSTMTSQPLRVGDIAEVTGFPGVRNGFPGLSHAGVNDTQQYAPILPVAIHWPELGLGENTLNLISIEGRLVRQVRETASDQYILEEDGHLFSAIYRHPLPEVGASVAEAKQIPEGSMVRVAGIGMFTSADSLNGPIATDILLQSPGGIVVTAPPSVLSIRNLMLAVGVLILIVFSVSIWGWFLERKVRRQTSAMADRNEAEATLQAKRSRILEDINASRPLVETVEEITQMVSCQLNGAPCWCEITDGAELGERPLDLSELRILQKDIGSRTGLLGTLFAALDLNSLPSAEETETLAVGARLATLAIETQRLYSDLHHRSEFDLLTDIHNRFSLDRYLEACVVEAHQTASVFGLIYLDLDDFKQINDVYGHHVGDVYLQQVTHRMKRQLRSADMLARIGGDEFVVLAPDVHNRAAVEEIALRLRRCFHETFLIEDHSIPGSASIGISLYPEDGVTRDALFNAADVAMYKAKQGKRQQPFGAVLASQGRNAGAV